MIVTKWESHIIRTTNPHGTSSDEYVPIFVPFRFQDALGPTVHRFESFFKFLGPLTDRSCRPPARFKTSRSDRDSMTWLKIPIKPRA